MRDQATADNEPTKRRSSSLVGDLAASILGADVLAARKAPPFPDDAEDGSDGTRYYFAGGGRSAKISSHGTLSPALAAKGVPPQQWAAFRDDLKKLPSLKRSMWRPLCRSSARKQAWLDAVEKLGDKYIALFAPLGIEVRASLDDRASTRHRGPAILFRYTPATSEPGATTTILVPPGTRGGDVIHARVDGREIKVTVPSPPPMKLDVAVPPPSAPQVGASYQPLQAPYVPKAPYHQQAPPPAMATELKASEAVPVGPPSARNQRARHRVDDVNDLEAPGRPPTPPWRARAPARNMSVAGVSGIN